MYELWAAAKSFKPESVTSQLLGTDAIFCLNISPIAYSLLTFKGARLLGTKVLLLDRVVQAEM